MIFLFLRKASASRRSEHHVPCRHRRDVRATVPVSLSASTTSRSWRSRCTSVSCTTSDRDADQHRPPHRTGKPPASPHPRPHGRDRLHHLLDHTVAQQRSSFGPVHVHIVGSLFHEFTYDDSSRDFFYSFMSLTLTPMMYTQFLAHRNSNNEHFSRSLEHGFDRMRDVLTKADLGPQAPVPCARQHRHHHLDHRPLHRNSEGILQPAHRHLYRRHTGARGCGLRHDTEEIEHCTTIILKDPAVEGLRRFTGATEGDPSERRAHVHPAQAVDRAPLRAAGDGAAQARARQVVSVSSTSRSVPDIDFGARLEQRSTSTPSPTPAPTTSIALRRSYSKNSRA